MKGKLCLSIAEAAAALGIGRSTFYAMAGRGEVPVRKIGGRSVVPVEALEELIHTAPLARLLSGRKSRANP